MEIDLKFDRKFFEEIFYFDNGGSYFNGNLTKKPFHNALISGILLVILTYYMLSENKFSMFALILIPAFVVSASLYIYNAIKLKKRRNNITKYLDKFELIESHKLILRNDSFTIQLDQDKYKEKWSDIMSMEISEICIYLSTDIENYMFPKKSFSDSEWQDFKRIINDRIDIRGYKIEQ